MPFYYGFDYYYIVLVLPCVIFAFYAQYKVNSTFKIYSAFKSSRNITGAMAAQAVLNAEGIYNVRIERVSGNLTDHYDPRENVIRLSDSVYASTSVSSIGVAAHEAGHAIQYAKGFELIKLRSAIIPITNIGSMLSMPMIIIGILINFSFLTILGIVFFGFSTIFQLITLPVELDASKRALSAIESNNILSDNELVMAKKTLWAAAMTYVAALAVSFAQLLRLVLIFGNRNNRDE